VLWIDTDRDEITIGFDMWHAHYGARSPELEEEAFAEAVGFLADLVSEEVVVVVKMRDGAWAGSHLVGRDEKLPYMAPGGHLRVVSWSGTLDREHTSEQDSLLAPPPNPR
jgi:hypothetical protein